MGILLALVMVLCLVSSPGVLAKGHQSAVSWNDRGISLWNARKYQEAIGAFNVAIKLNPKYAEAYSNRGAAYDGLNHPESSVMDYSKALALNPRLTQTYQFRALAYSDLGKFKEAIEDWNFVLKHQPRDSYAYSKRAVCFQSLGDSHAALRDYEKAVALNPHLLSAVKGRDLMKKALAVSTKPAGKQEAATVVSAATSARERAAPVLQAERQSVKPALTQPAASAVVNESKQASKTPLAGAAVPQAAPAAAQGSTEKMAIESAAGAPVGGLTEAVKAGAPGPLSAERQVRSVLCHMAGNVLFACGQFDAAAAKFREAEASNASDPFAFYREGNALAAAGHRQEAIKCYDTAIRLNPRFGQALAKRQRAANSAGTMR